MITGTPVYDICTISDSGQDDILISRFAPYLAHHKNLFAAHKHTFYHLVLFTEAAGTHNIDFENFDARPYQIYFMVPGQVHSWAFKGHVDGYVINFSEAFFQSFLLNPGYIGNLPFFSGDLKDAVINLPQAVHEPLRLLFEEIILESEDAEVQGIDMI